MSDETNRSPEWVKACTMLSRLSLVLVLAGSAWAGLWMSGMGKGAALAVALAGGMLSMVAGMLCVGVRYHREMQELKAAVSDNNRKFGQVAVLMAKAVAEEVAVKVIARHTARLPGPEHVEAALVEAKELVGREIISYVDKVRAKDAVRG